MQEKTFLPAGQTQRGGTVQSLRAVGLSCISLLLSASMALAGSPKDTVFSRGVSDPTVFRSGLPMFLTLETVLPGRGVRLYEEAGAANVEPASSVGGELTGTLTVTTEPAGATVYVGGQPRGETPVEIVGLQAGDHRITIVKDGYLDNSRVLNLATDRSESLSVALTPGAAGSGATELQEDSDEGGGGGWWKWAALAGGGAAATYLLLPKNKPPVAGLSVMPGGSGMAGVTQYRFDGGASSDPDNDQLTYSWNFGDGGNGSGRNTTHVYDSAGTYTVTLTVSDGKLQATATSSVTVTQNLDNGNFSTPRDYNLTRNGRDTGIRFAASLRLTQTGSSLGGRIEVRLSDRSGATERHAGSISGRISSSNNFICPCDVEFSTAGYSFTGSVDNGATLLSGRDELRITVRDGEARRTFTFRGPVEYRRQ